jgi:hypothetical protein
LSPDNGFFYAHLSPQLKLIGAAFSQSITQVSLVIISFPHVFDQMPPVGILPNLPLVACPKHAQYINNLKSTPNSNTCGD